jgi:hypothetical protein|tara:strand:- start:61 stop:333 length:273 start_codon:yes stop_codon:yes gene_type:complete
MNYQQAVQNENLYDYEYDRLDELENAREFAREQMVQTLLADEPVILDGQKWTLEELIEARMEFTDGELDDELQRIKADNFVEPEINAGGY